jgi:acetyl/propionyl-CoA carboxylase alpha subunit
VSWPTGPGVRVDTWVDTGTTVTPYYDSLLAKVMVHAPTRPQAIKKLIAVLGVTQVP